MYQGTHSWIKSGSTILHSEPTSSLPESFSVSFSKNHLAKRRIIQMQVEINTLSKLFSINCKLSKKNSTCIFTFRQRFLFVKSNLKWINYIGTEH